MKTENTINVWYFKKNYPETFKKYEKEIIADINEKGFYVIVRDNGKQQSTVKLIY